MSEAERIMGKEIDWKNVREVIGFAGLSAKRQKVFQHPVDLKGHSL